MRRFFLLLIAAFLYSGSAHSQTQPVTTGLGTCVDFITSASQTITSQANNHKAAGLTMSYSSYSRFDPVTKNIFVTNYDCSTMDVNGIYYTVGRLSHELGHWTAGNPDISGTLTKAQFIELMCTWEGVAVRNNNVARVEIDQFSSGDVTIPIIAQNESTMLAMLANGDSPEKMGATFCDTNTNDEGKIYSVAYSEYYDANYPF